MSKELRIFSIKPTFTMNRLFPILLLLALGSCAPTAQKPVKKAVFVIVDGIPADVLEKLHPPTIDSIAGDKGYCRAFVGGIRGSYSETPTISAPGYMDLITGVWGNKHNVWDNDNQQPNYHYHNIFRIVEEANPAFKTAVFSTWLDNRTVLIGEGQSNAGAFKIDYAFDGFEKDTMRFPHDGTSRYILNIDEHVSTEAGRYIAEQGPDLSWVYLEYTDDMGHEFGDSEPFYAAIQQADRQINRIWNGVKTRQKMGEDWLIVVTTDHGRDTINGMEHGGQSDRERITWIATNAQALNPQFSAEHLAITDIAPSILRHLGIQAPEPVQAEMDGRPFFGPISVGALRFVKKETGMSVSWQAFNPKETLQVWLSLDNKHKTGGKDQFELLGHVPAGQGAMPIQFSAEQQARYAKSGFAKILVKGVHNWANAWLDEL